MYSVLDPIESSSEAADFETAIHFASYGKFQKILLGICGMIYATCAISTTTLSFVLPSAQCDFDLSSLDKGKLSASPLIGMIVGCSLWGYIANSQGRKPAIMLSLLVDFLAAITSSFVQSFNVFLICRFFNGFGIIGATSLVFSYLGEFLPRKKRDEVLGRLEIFWNVGVIILPGLAWTLLRKPNEIIFVLEEDDYYYKFNPWRIFVLVCSLPSITSLVLLYFMPETPKYLISKGKYEKAMMVFRKVYTINTGQSPHSYPVLSLEEELINNNNAKRQPEDQYSFVEGLKQKCQNILRQLKELLTGAHLRYLCITSFADFGLMASYYTLIMWFPEIFERFNSFEAEHPNESSSVCHVSQNPVDDDWNFVFECDPFVSNSVFIETAIIGLSCIPTSVGLSYFMKKIGKKYVLVICLAVSGVSVLALNWVYSTAQTLMLSCIFEAFTSILESVLFCVVVDLFPTNLRAIALAVTATSGRLGAIFGNVLFGILIDFKCVVPIYMFGSLLLASGFLCGAIPKSEDYIMIH